MTGRCRLLVVFVVLMSLVACGARPRPNSMPRREPDTDRRPAPDTSNDSGDGDFASNVDTGKPTELWVLGVGKQPHLAAEVDAMGARGFSNLREADGGVVREMLQRYVDLNIGVAITVRWVDPARPEQDKPPTRREQDAALATMMEALTTPEARRLDGRLWIGFYSELANGGGSVPYADCDPMFEFATRASQRIRREAPWVRIAGPGLTKVDILTKDPSRIGRGQREYYDYNDRIIRWCVEHADAVDLHLHVESAEEAERRIGIVQDHLAKIPGGNRIDIIAQEWSPAFYPDRNDLDGVRDCILGTYRVMNENGFPWAAYGAYYTFPGQPEHFHWKNLVNSDRSPHEPFHSIFTNLAKQVRSGDVSGVGR